METQPLKRAFSATRRAAALCRARSPSGHHAWTADSGDALSVVHFVSCRPPTPSPNSSPRSSLTTPSDPHDNDGYDNVNADLILRVGDSLEGSSTGRAYIVRDTLGSGTFGQVVRCTDTDTGAAHAVKVIKNLPAYYHQGKIEIGVLQLLNSRGDPHDRHHIVRLTDWFVHRSHLCLVFEVLSVNLYDLIRHNRFRGLSVNLLRVFLRQILGALDVLRQSSIVHCDLKPENVLLKTLNCGEIKVIDFGSACFEGRTVYSYIQSRFYRAPEVVLRHPYTGAIDMWSLGCIAAELFLGLPLFPGASEHDLMTRIAEMLGPPPEHVLAAAKATPRFYRRAAEGEGAEGGTARTTGAVGAGPSAPGAPSTPTDPTSSGADPSTSAAGGRHRAPGGWILRDKEDFERHARLAAPQGKRYFKHTGLPEILASYPYRSGLSKAQQAREREQRASLLDLLRGLLDLDPGQRWTPRQASGHPFVRGEPFLGPYTPPPAEPVGLGAAAPAGNPVPRPMGAAGADMDGGDGDADAGPAEAAAPRAAAPVPVGAGWQPIPAATPVAAVAAPVLPTPSLIGGGVVGPGGAPGFVPGQSPLAPTFLEASPGTQLVAAQAMQTALAQAQEASTARQEGWPAGAVAGTAAPMPVSAPMPMGGIAAARAAPSASADPAVAFGVTPHSGALMSALARGGGLGVAGGAGGAGGGLPSIPSASPLSAPLAAGAAGAGAGAMPVGSHGAAGSYGAGGMPVGSVPDLGGHHIMSVLDTRGAAAMAAAARDSTGRGAAAGHGGAGAGVGAGGGVGGGAAGPSMGWAAPQTGVSGFGAPATAVAGGTAATEGGAPRAPLRAGGLSMGLAAASSAQPAPSAGGDANMGDGGGGGGGGVDDDTEMG